MERLTAINQLIQVAEPTEVRHMMRVIEPQFQRDFISLLPKEVSKIVEGGDEGVWSRRALKYLRI